MHRMKRFGPLAIAILVGVAACENNEGVDPNDGALPTAEQPMLQDLDPETVQQIQEIQDIQQRLEPLQQAALQDEALAAQLDALQIEVEAAMHEEDSELVQELDRIQGAMIDAQTAGDQAEMQALMMQAQAMQAEAEALQAAVFERPDIRARIDAFQTAHRARMIEIDPEAEPLLDRLDELVANLSV